jgi:hypothetical protein
MAAEEDATKESSGVMLKEVARCSLPGEQTGAAKGDR